MADKPHAHKHSHWASVLTRGLLVQRTSHERETGDGDPSRSHPPILAHHIHCPVPNTHKLKMSKSVFFYSRWNAMRWCMMNNTRSDFTVLFSKQFPSRLWDVERSRQCVISPDLEPAQILLLFHLSSRQIEPGPTPQGWRNALLTPQLYLQTDRRSQRLQLAHKSSNESYEGL